jgi:4-coumarate--CoA ligase (photoactive yellow protein activation family)
MDALTPFGPVPAADPALHRWLRDLLAAELAALRPGRPAPASAAWTPEADLAADFGVDSLELLGLSSALSDVLRPAPPEALLRLFEDTRLSTWITVLGEAWAAADARQLPLPFRTSGSTGTPKRCLHARAELAAELDAHAAWAAGTGRVVAAVRSHHIYGFLFTLWWPRRAEGGPRPVLDVCGQPPAAVLPQLRPGDLVVAFPDWWAAWLRAGLSPPPGVTGLTSTAPCPDPLAQALVDEGLARLVQVFGSTETGGVGWRDAPGAPWRLLSPWERDAADPQRLRRAPTPAVQAPDGDRTPPPVDLPDHVEWVDARHFHLRGRRDGLVQVGGVNVSPDLVAQRLRAHPEVADAVLRLHPGPVGPRLKAFVVPRPGVDRASLPSRLLAWSSWQLVPAARPVHVSVGDALPRDTMGKPCDWPLQPLIDDTGSHAEH